MYIPAVPVSELLVFVVGVHNSSQCEAKGIHPGVLSLVDPIDIFFPRQADIIMEVCKYVFDSISCLKVKIKPLNFETHRENAKVLKTLNIFL